MNIQQPQMCGGRHDSWNSYKALERTTEQYGKSPFVSYSYKNSSPWGVIKHVDQTL